jgi:hypothetical protein
MYLNLKILAVFGINLWERFISWYQDSSLRELLLRLDRNLFSVEFGVYENLSLPESLPTTAKNVILGLTIGTVLAAALMFYTKRVQGKFIRALLARGCNSPETAATLMELGMFRNDSVRRDLARGGALTKLALCVQREALRAESVERNETENGQENTAEGEEGELDSVSEKSEHEAKIAEKRDTYLDFRPDFTVARYYIPEELRYRAEFRYTGKGTGVGFFLLTVALCLVGAALLCAVLPILAGFANWLVGVLAP